MPRISQQLLFSAIALLSLAACTFDLDDPTGTKQRLAQARSAECQQIYTLTETHYAQSLAAYQQGLAADGTRTKEGLLHEAEVHGRNAETLEALDLADQNLNRLSRQLAVGLRQLATAKQAMAPFAEVERTIIATSDRSDIHQASVKQRDDARDYYSGMQRALEAYCAGEDLPPDLF